MTLAIVDYGSGNLRSASKAIERAISDLNLGISVKVTSNAQEVSEAERIVLPGVGAFGDCLEGLSNVQGMIEALNQAVIVGGKPFLGICVGMQLMADKGFEHGEHKGLGWVSGDVKEIPSMGFKVPHMGWNDLIVSQPMHPVLKGINSGDHAYFVHSFQFNCSNDEDVLATVKYGGTITSIVARGNCVGTQFHPEKSQSLGLRLISNFLQWKP